MPRGPVMAGRYWPVEYAPAGAFRLPVPSSAFTPSPADAANAAARMEWVRHEHARDVVTLQVVAQAVEEIGRHHPQCRTPCEVCRWLSRAIAATRARSATL